MPSTPARVAFSAAEYTCRVEHGMILLEERRWGNRAIDVTVGPYIVARARGTPTTSTCGRDRGGYASLRPKRDAFWACSASTRSSAATLRSAFTASLANVVPALRSISSSAVQGANACRTGVGVWSV